MVRTKKVFLNLNGNPIFLKIGNLSTIDALLGHCPHFSTYKPCAHTGTASVLFYFGWLVDFSTKPLATLAASKASCKPQLLATMHKDVYEHIFVWYGKWCACVRTWLVIAKMWTMGQESVNSNIHWFLKKLLLFKVKWTFAYCNLHIVNMFFKWK